MPFTRYKRTPILNFGEQYGTGRAQEAIRAAVASGVLTTKPMIVRGVERLDTIAGVVYGDGRYWWIIAAASGIGWGMQIPPGTILRIPSLGDVASLTG